MWFLYDSKSKANIKIVDLISMHTMSAILCVFEMELIAVIDLCQKCRVRRTPSVPPTRLSANYPKLTETPWLSSFSISRGNYQCFTYDWHVLSMSHPNYIMSKKKIPQ